MIARSEEQYQFRKSDILTSLLKSFKLPLKLTMDSSKNQNRTSSLHKLCWVRDVYWCSFVLNYQKNLCIEILQKVLSNKFDRFPDHISQCAIY